MSCHVGTAQDDDGLEKIVTHDMYAAGHPPLPGIEVDTFCDQMPRHWRYRYEKDEAVQQQIGYDKTSLERVQTVIVSGVMALNVSMDLLASQAAKTWPDFTYFDCYACHHDLNSPSWRAERGYEVTPGRPTFRPWPTALVELGIRLRAGDGGDDEIKKFQAALKDLYDAFDAQPFGDPEQVKEAAASLAGWSRALAEGLREIKVDQSVGLRALRIMASMDHVADDGFDSARLLAWAILSVYSQTASAFSNGDAIQQRLDMLKTELFLNLPAGTAESIIGTLPQSLEKIADYSPESFKAHLAELRKLLQ